MSGVSTQAPMIGINLLIAQNSNLSYVLKHTRFNIVGYSWKTKRFPGIQQRFQYKKKFKKKHINNHGILPKLHIDGLPARRQLNIGVFYVYRLRHILCNFKRFYVSGYRRDCQLVHRTIRKKESTYISIVFCRCIVSYRFKISI